MPDHTVNSIADAFSTLRLPPTTDLEKVQKAWRTEIQRVHPDRIGPNELASAVNGARDSILDAADTGQLALIVGWLAKTGRAERPPDTVRHSASDVVPMSVKAAFPDLNKHVVVEYTGGGRYAIWVYGRMFRANSSGRGVCVALRSNISPRFAGSYSSVPVWVFAPGSLKKLVDLASLPEELEEIEAGSLAAPPPPPTPGRRAPPAEPRSPYAPHRGPEPELPVEPPESLRQAFRNVDWRGMFSGFAIYAGSTGTYMFQVARVKGRIDFTPVGAYEGSAAALLSLSRQNITPDVVPVWFMHESLGENLARLGAA